MNEQPQPHWENPEARKWLEVMGGSKSGAHAYLQAKHPELHEHLPSGTRHISRREDIERALSSLDYGTPKIVRGCHFLDVFGMVDALPTEVNIRGREAVRKAIEQIFRAGENPQIHSFVEYETGKAFDGKVDVLVQDYCGEVRGSIIEHPHERDVYRIEEVDPGRFQDIIKKEVCDSTGKGFRKVRSGNGRERQYNNYSGEIDSEQAIKIIELYKRVRDSGLMPSTHSFQMEYGFNQNANADGQPMFYQARLFRLFEPMADFDFNFGHLPDGIMKTLAYDSFGITPPDGLLMPRAELTAEFIEKCKGKEGVAYAHNSYKKHRTTTPLNLQPRNMAAYLPYQFEVLEHGHYRWMQKAPITLVGAGQADPNEKEYRASRMIQPIERDMRVRVYSNGFEGIVVPLEGS